jgi:hypothetical protein
MIVSITGLIFKLLDNTSMLCAADSWIQGHAIWHCLGALSSLFMFLFYYSEQGKPIDYSRAHLYDGILEQQVEPQKSVDETIPMDGTVIDVPLVLTEKQERILTKQMLKFDPREFLNEHYDYEKQRLK